MKNRVGLVLITGVPLIIGLLLIMFWAPTVPPAFAGNPCCSIVAVDQATGRVTLRDLKTGQTFQVTVQDAARLKTLKVGEPVERTLGPALK